MTRRTEVVVKVADIRRLWAMTRDAQTAEEDSHALTHCYGFFANIISRLAFDEHKEGKAMTDTPKGE